MDSDVEEPVGPVPDSPEPVSDWKTWDNPQSPDRNRYTKVLVLVLLKGGYE